MKRIAFFVQWMLCGGVENALISLAKKLQSEGHDVYIYAIKNEGEFVKKIPYGVKFSEIPMPRSTRSSIPVGGTKVSVRNAIREKQYAKAVRFLIRHQFSKCEFAELNVNKEAIPTLQEKFDIAVNFHIHSPFLVWYVSQKVDATKKFAWIHNDFTTTQYNIKILQKYLVDVDRFFAVAQNLVSEFSTIFPEYKDKIEIALNIVPKEEILIKSEKFYPEEFDICGKDTVKILTVGRLEEQKGYDIAVKVCKYLKERDLKFQWFILGNGTQKATIQSEIKKLNLEDYMHLLGTKMNPYPYFRHCDIYVQTSKHEGYVTTVTEAKILKRPIVTTDVSGAREQLIDKVNGEITTFDPTDIAHRIETLILNEDVRNRYSDKLEKLDGYLIGDWIDNFNKR